MSNRVNDGHYEFWVCRRCGNRIHRSQVGNPLVGVECCGRLMSPPGRPVYEMSPGIAWAVLIWLVGGTFVLCHYFGWMIWTAILLTLATAILFCWIAEKAKKIRS